MIVVTGNNGDLPLATQRRVESIASGDRPSPSLDRIYQLGLWLAIFFAIFLRLPPNKFLRIPPDVSPVSIRLALLFLLLFAQGIARLMGLKGPRPSMVGAIFLCCRLQPGPREFGGNLGGNAALTAQRGGEVTGLQLGGLDLASTAERK